MKILVATNITQGRRKNDFAHATLGELVTFSEECDGETTDGPCGCRRSFSGLTSHRATTTALVVDRPDLTLELLTGALTSSYTKTGIGNIFSEAELATRAHEDAAELARIASCFPLGSVLERRGPKVQVRQLRAAKAPPALR